MIDSVFSQKIRTKMQSSVEIPISQAHGGLYPPPPATSGQSIFSGSASSFGEDHEDQTSSASAPLRVQSKPRQPWIADLCGCLDDIENCCLTLWCPWITFGRIAEIVDRGSTSCGTSGAIYAVIASVTCCQSLYSCLYRSKLRSQYRLHQDPCMDCFVHLFCEYCALCQEYRELNRRGFDMKIGWEANVVRRTRGITTLPPHVNAGMSREETEEEGKRTD